MADFGLGSGAFGRRLTQSEAYALGYRNVCLRRDDRTVQSMETRDGYRVAYGAPSYSSAVERADRATPTPEPHHD